MEQEARIVINWIEMSQAAAMAIRVALEAFAMDLSDNGLGDDPMGRALTASYLESVSEIRQAIYRH